MAAILADPVGMIEQGAPHVIHSEEQLQAYTAALERLTSIQDPSPAEVEAIELLTLLVDSYEDKHYALPKATPAGIVRFLLDQHGLKQRDLVPEFGTESAVSMFLSGARQLSVQQIQALSARFRISPEVLL